MRSFQAVACVLAVAVLTPRISLASNPIVYEVVKDYMHSYRTTLTVGADGRVYGTTTGPMLSPSVFRIDGTTITTIHTFDTFEGTPYRLVLGTNGSLFGITDGGAPATSPDYCCTFFRIDTAGNYSSSFVPMPAHLLRDWTGLDPGSDLVRGSDGAFYAALAQSRCSLSGCAFPGGVGKITEAGVFTLLTGLTEFGGSDGMPLGPGSDGLMYGIGGFSPPGLLVRWDAAGVETAIRSFTEAESGDGSINGFVLGSDGLLYAAAPYGGTGHGSVFRFDPAGNVTLLHQFNNTDGAQPSAPMTLGSDGAMYGVTSFGGADSEGTVYRIKPDGTFTSLFSFSGTNGSAANHALVLANNGMLYAPTQSGWPLAGVARVNPAAGTVNSFNLPSGVAPSSPLVQANGGWLYGVANVWNPTIQNSDTSIYRIIDLSAPLPVPAGGTGLRLSLVALLFALGAMRLGRDGRARV